MTKKYKIIGLDCPNCAKTLETKICSLPTITSAKIDFFKQTIEIESQSENAVYDAINLAKKIEPDAKIIVKNETKTSKKFIIDLCLLVLGIAEGLIALFVKMPSWAFWILFVTSALSMGYNTFFKAFQLLIKKTINENFLVTISVIGASAVGEYMDALMVIALYSIGKILENIALSKSRKSIEELTNLKPESVSKIVGESITIVTSSEIETGDIILVKPGEKVAVDGIIVEGEANFDVSSLTGESLPKLLSANDEAISGSIVLDGTVKILATNRYENSTAKKIMDMIENASEKKSKTETVISKISRWYSFGVICLSLVVFGIVWAISKDINSATYRGLIFLVVSCPCAFAISVPLSYFSGLGNASKKGILIKGSNYLDQLATIKTIAFDKTGTLTNGDFSIKKIVSYCEKSEDEILWLCALGEQNSTHPLASSILSSNKKKLEEISNFKEIAGKGICFEFKGNNYFVGRKSNNLEETAVEIFENETKIGSIIFEDSIKENSKIACEKLNKLGINVVMLSGDNKEIVERVSSEIGIKNAYSNLLPQDKFNWIETQIKERNEKIAYVGDGLNDAPSLTVCDVGISMGLKGNPASIEASDIVLANDNPEKIVDAIKISRFTKKIVWQNIALSSGIKIVFLVLGSFGITGILSAVIADVGVTLLAIFNSLRALKFNPKKKG